VNYLKKGINARKGIKLKLIPGITQKSKERFSDFSSKFDSQRDVLVQGSLDLLNLMLQTDPKKRITVQQLLAHPWLMDGYDKPVKYQSR